MDTNISVEDIDLILHFVVSEEKLFALFGLILEFSG